MWENLVVLPIMHAHERLTRSKPDEDGALADVDFALRGIAAVKVATPQDDPNRARVEILEIRVSGLRDLIQELRGKAKSSSDLERQMIEWRAEATALGPELTHRPRRPPDESTDADSSAASKAPSGGESGRSEASTQAGGAEASTMAVPRLWRDLVVDYLWKGQQAMDRSADEAKWWFIHAANNSGYFAYGTPVGDPNRLRQYRLFHGLVTLSELVSARAGHLDAMLIDSADVAYDHAMTLLKRLTGQPVGEEPAAPEATEPEFTWESREGVPFVNDTNLERP
jgi:hypothetical protein